ncbi:MAG TPA: SLC13 family permease [Trebonia sp.]|nr:SLC13 family permease [Trebonia sp.]
MSVLVSLRRSLAALDWVALALLAGGLVLVATGLLPGQETEATVRRILPLLLFLATVLVLAELTAAAGVFDVVATLLAIMARGSFAALFAACVAFAALTTICLNLDTTAVLLTPVMLALAVALRVPGRGEPGPGRPGPGAAALPLAMCTVWLASTASLLLPVSNLTNLLAADRIALSPPAFAVRMAPAQAASLLVTAAALWLFYWRRGRRGARRYTPPRPFRPADPWLARVAGLACLFFIIATLGGVPLGVASALAACVVVAAFAVRQRSALRWSLIPWRLPVLVTGLFLVVQTISLHVLGPVTTSLAGTSGGASGTFRAAATGAVLANLVNNLPAYVAGEAAIPAANHVQLLGLLIGVNVGPLITPWGSLATMLWLERCRAAGVVVPLRRLMLGGACLALAATALSVAALLWT